MNIHFDSLSRRFLAAILLSLTGAGAINAEEFYKTVDANGNVSYSSVRPDANSDVEAIPVFPAPSEDTILAAQEELQQVQQEFEQKREESLVSGESSAQESIQAIESAEEKKKAPPLPGFNPFIGLAPFL